jgi:hypothetical protein
MAAEVQPSPSACSFPTCRGTPQYRPLSMSPQLCLHGPIMDDEKGEGFPSPSHHLNPEIPLHFSRVSRDGGDAGIAGRCHGLGDSIFGSWSSCQI